MINVKYSYNWNNKLECKCYTTIRLRNDKKYRVGETYNASLNDKHLHYATLKVIKHFKINQLTEGVAMIDTGYDKQATITLLRRMYKNKNIDWSTQELSFLIFSQNKKK